MIGLEVHVQINTETKLFSSAKNQEGEPNTNVNNIDIGIPGCLPQLNFLAMEKAVKTGLAFNCEINHCSRFDRKHYSYPDLPLGYQITQFYEPVCKGGYIETQFSKVRINRIHVETDSGKMIHTSNNSLLDYNRCGIPLMEIVTEPDMNSSESVVAFLVQLIQTLKCIETSNCSMDKGNLRVDINISIADDQTRYPRVEIKNVNSVNFVRKAVETEIKRQVQCVKNKEYYKQHTRRYDSDSDTTSFMRSKENELDYRYMPDFNIPAFRISESFINSIELPELPKDRRERYKKVIRNKELIDIITDKTIGNYFDKVYSKVKDPELAANFIVSDLVPNWILLDFNTENLIEIINMTSEGKISTKTAKYLLTKCANKNPSELIEEENLIQITDQEFIKSIVLEVTREYPDELLKYKAGKEKLFQFFMGKCISRTNGRCNPEILESVLKQLL